MRLRVCLLTEIKRYKSAIRIRIRIRIRNGKLRNCQVFRHWLCWILWTSWRRLSFCKCFLLINFNNFIQIYSGGIPNDLLSNFVQYLDLSILTITIFVTFSVLSFSIFFLSPFLSFSQDFILLPTSHLIKGIHSKDQTHCNAIVSVQKKSHTCL